MDEKTAISFILRKVNAMDAQIGFGLGESSVATIKNVLQHDANKVVSEFMRNRDPGPVLELIATMHAYGGITDKDYNQLTTTFSKET